MSFFDKFFRHNICSNKTENDLKINSELSKSSNLYISKEQIRFLLFRECDKRGRKLLFDSNAIEKILLTSKGINQTKKCSFTNNKKYLDYIEITDTHGYQYKKPSDDIDCLGEMIFGSVAMTYKGENSCKIHKIPSPKKLMFTTIIHAPLRCHVGGISECSSESSSASMKNSSKIKETSSSDSKLLKPVEVAQKCSSTYPCEKNTLGLDKLVQCCNLSSIEKINETSSHLTIDNVSKPFDNLLTSDNENSISACVFSEEPKIIYDKISLEQDILLLNVSQKNSGCDHNSSCNTNSAVSIFSYESENVSNVSGSLSSLRRRWAQSNSASLDTTSREDISNTPCKKKTKLGMALVLDISDSIDDEMDSFLFNHTILIDSIMNKLQSSVESAYIKNQNFVDLIHTAFVDAQQNIYDFITGEKYKLPFWIALLGDSDDFEADKKDNVCFGSESNSGCYGARESKFSLRQFSSPVKIKKTCKDQGSISNAKIKFLNEFQDVLVRFDTKDTNFFISTLLTAVLTHHLSWVTAIAETDSPNRHEKVQSVIKNYNPIWAQLNDLCGLLGSPLKYSKTIVKGSDGKRFYITAILQILTYFIRCFNVIENVYDVDIENIIGKIPDSVEVTNHCEGFDPITETLKNPEALQINSSILVNVSNENKNINERLELLNFCESGRKGLGRKQVSSTCLNSSNCEICSKIYSDTTDVMKNENIYETNLKFLKLKEVSGEADISLMVENTKKNLPFVEKTCQNFKNHSEGCLNPDEGYDTIDLSKADSLYLCPVATKETEVLEASADNEKEDIVFVLGENEKLVNLRKSGAKTGIKTVDQAKDEDSKNYAQELKNVPLQSVSRCDKTCPTFDGESKSCSEQTSSENYDINQVSLNFLELPMPCETKPSRRKCLGVSSVIGGVNRRYNSEQIIQGLVDPDPNWEDNLQKDLYLCAHNSTVEKNISEAICIVGDVDTWEVTVRTSNTSVLDRKKSPGVRVIMSQLVADMLESFLAIHKINLPPNFCLMHIEKKLREIYLKSKTIAELLTSTDLCTIDYITTRLDIGINDIPLLLSVATTHSPQISDKYGLSFN